jgi:hypothetical protein
MLPPMRFVSLFIIGIGFVRIEAVRFFVIFEFVRCIGWIGFDRWVLRTAWRCFVVRFTEIKDKGWRPKRNQSQIFSHTQSYRTKAHNLAQSKNVPNTTKFCPTSSGSSEFGQNSPSHHFDLRQIPNSQIYFHTDQQSNTMPKIKQLDVIRLQQTTVVTNLVEIARYTHTKPVYTEMTQQDFNKTIRNLNCISTLRVCTCSIKATRHGQKLAENRPLCSLLPYGKLRSK